MKPAKLISALIYVSVVMTIWNTAHSQELEDYFSYSVTSGDIYVLNSVNKTNIANGKNRNTVTYHLPKNTKYALVRVIVDNSDYQIDKKNYQSLMGKYVTLAKDPNLLLTGSLLIEAVTPSKTGKTCDFYLPIKTEDSEKFIADGHPWKYKVSEINYVDMYTRLNTQSFALLVNADDLSEKCLLHLAFQNHSFTNACKVVIDILAFVDKEHDTSGIE